MALEVFGPLFPVEISRMEGMADFFTSARANGQAQVIVAIERTDDGEVATSVGVALSHLVESLRVDPERMVLSSKDLELKMSRGSDRHAYVVYTLTVTEE
jgi:hypothetical protein